MILLFIPDASLFVIEALPPDLGIKYTVPVAQSSLVTQEMLALALAGQDAPKNLSAPGKKA
jgi:hypothetical protein